MVCSPEVPLCYAASLTITGNTRQNASTAMTAYGLVMYFHGNYMKHGVLQTGQTALDPFCRR